MAKLPTIDRTNGATLYASLNAYLGEKTDRPAGNNTRIRRGSAWSSDDAIRVRLHHTDVVTIHPDGSVELQWRGWRTLTTHDRMNTYIPNGWYVYGLCDTLLVHAGRNAWLACDGMTINPDGTVSGATFVGDPQDYGREQKNKRARERRAEVKARKERVRENWARFRDACDTPAIIAQVQDVAEHENEERESYYRPNHDHRLRNIVYDRQQEKRIDAWRETLPSVSKETPLLAWKYLHLRNGVIESNYDYSPWTVGEWRDDRVTQPCHGLNCSSTPAQAYRFVCGDVLARVEVAGKYHEGQTKITADSMRIIAAWIYRDSDIYSDTNDNWTPAGDHSPDFTA